MQPPTIEDEILTFWAELKARTGGEASLMEATTTWLADHELEAEEIVARISASFRAALEREAVALRMLRDRPMPNPTALDLF